MDKAIYSEIIGSTLLKDMLLIKRIIIIREIEKKANPISREKKVSFTLLVKRYPNIIEEVTMRMKKMWIC